jgi:hypothetical protein
MFDIIKALILHSRKLNNLRDHKSFKQEFNLEIK